MLLLSLLCLLKLGFSITVYSSADKAFCHEQHLPTTPTYKEVISSVSQKLERINNNYPKFKLYLVTPTYIGCLLPEIEIVVVDPDFIRYQNEATYIALSDEISENNATFENRMMIVRSLGELLPAVLERLVPPRRPRTSRPRSIKIPIHQVIMQIAVETGLSIQAMVENETGIEISIPKNTVEGRRKQFLLLASQRIKRPVHFIIS